MGYLFNMPGVAMDIKFCSVHAALNGDVEPSNFIEKCSTIKNVNHNYLYKIFKENKPLYNYYVLYHNMHSFSLLSSLLCRTEDQLHPHNELSQCQSCMSRLCRIIFNIHWNCHQFFNRPFSCTHIDSYIKVFRILAVIISMIFYLVYWKLMFNVWLYKVKSTAGTDAMPRWRCQSNI